ncbi:hypothetical protein [Ruegeria sp. HKCCA4633]|uniref:hypothetical protein n=1 Tax=Ruegeria sp. HKCCA4633 TaxID=2682983 RepID=UPI0014888B87|nr:hypothetical protein [Ruegeria sp. HKCCA4633]
MTSTGTDHLMKEFVLGVLVHEAVQESLECGLDYPAALAHVRNCAFMVVEHCALCNVDCDVEDVYQLLFRLAPNDGATVH